MSNKPLIDGFNCKCAVKIVSPLLYGVLVKLFHCCTVRRLPQPRFGQQFCANPKSNSVIGVVKLIGEPFYCSFIFNKSTDGVLTYSL